MTLTFSPRVIRFTNAAWPELAQLGGLGGVRVRVVRFQPWLSPVAAMAWRGEVLVRRGWIAPCLHDLGPGNEIPDKHIWAISLLAWHEPHHLAEQQGRSWSAYVACYLGQWIKAGFRYRKMAEERAAYARQARLTRMWAEHAQVPTEWSRPGRTLLSPSISRLKLF